MEPLHFRSHAAQAPDTSKGPIFNRVLAPSLRSVANWVLTRFAYSHLVGGGRSRFAPSHPGGRPHFTRSLTIIRFPFNHTNVWDHAIPSLLLLEIVLAIASNFDLRNKEGGNSDCSTIGTFT